ncbi:MAG TPA: PKD domain-containing protein [Solirubrobacteraceae bacterium]
MTAPRLHLVLGLVLSMAIVLTHAVGTAGAQGPAAGADARVSSSFVMHGVIVTAVRVHGEHRGQRVTRQWSFMARSCQGSVCQRLLLRRERSAHHYNRLVLSRVGTGRYAGRGRFYAGLRCGGRHDPRGEVVPYRITVAVTNAVVIGGVEFARGITASYTNLARIDRTRCPIGPSHDAARYTGVASALPTPPAAAFAASAVGATPVTDSVQFTDTSTPGAARAPIVGWLWNFGDGSSGDADKSPARDPVHTFTAPGTYAVCLIVTDANGLRAGLCRDVTVPVARAGSSVRLSPRSGASPSRPPAGPPAARAGPEPARPRRTGRTGVPPR